MANKKDLRSQLHALGWAVGVASVVFLLSSSAPEWAVALTVVAGILGFTYAFYRHGWFRAPTPIGNVILAPFLVLLICAVMVSLGYSAWPTVEVTPEILNFDVPSPAGGEEYVVRVANHKSRDVYTVEIELDAGNENRQDFRVYVSQANLRLLNDRGGPSQQENAADIMALNCTRRYTEIVFHRLRPQESREFIVQHKVPGQAKINLSTYYFSTKATSAIASSQWTGMMLHSPNHEECKNLSIGYFFMQPARPQ